MIRRTVKKILKSAQPAAPASYRDWWDSASTTLERAYESTITITNEEEYRLRGLYGDNNSFGALELIRRCQLTRTSKVLEIGSGIGRIGKEMAPHVSEWHGSDVSRNMIALGRKRCEGLKNIFFHEIHGIANFAEKHAEEFDLVYMTVVLMHLDKEDVFEYLRQAQRMVKMGGHAHFDTWNILHPDVFRMWRTQMPPGENKSRGRYQCSTPAELRLYLEEAGFEIESMDEDERLIRTFCRKRIAKPAAINDDGKPPFGYLCMERNATIRGVHRVEGWSLDKIAKVEILIDGVFIGTAIRNHVRPEVPPLFPRYAPECAKCGFYFDLDTMKLEDGHHFIAVSATDSNGNTTVITGPYQGIVVANNRS